MCHEWKQTNTGKKAGEREKAPIRVYCYASILAQLPTLLQQQSIAALNSKRKVFFFQLFFELCRARLLLFAICDANVDMLAYRHGAYVSVCVCRDDFANMHLQPAGLAGRTHSYIKGGNRPHLHCRNSSNFASGETGVAGIKWLFSLFQRSHEFFGGFGKAEKINEHQPKQSAMGTPADLGGIGRRNVHNTYK